MAPPDGRCGCRARCPASLRHLACLQAKRAAGATRRNLTRPAVIKEKGLLIRPLKYSKGAAEKTAGTEGKGGRLAAGAGPSKARPRVKVVAGSLPRN